MTDGIVDGLPGEEWWPEGGHRPVEIGNLVELLLVGPLRPFDAAVELGRSGREHVQADAALPAGLLESGHELAAAVHLDRPDGERHAGIDGAQEGSGAGRRGLTSDAEHVPARDDIAGGELLEDDARERSQIERINLDEVARGTGQVLLRLARRVGPRRPGTMAGARRPQRLDQQASRLQGGEDAADHRGRGRPALLAEEPDELVLAPSRVLLAQLKDGPFQLGAPRPLAYPVGPSRPALERRQVLGVVAPQPAIERLGADVEVAAGQPRVPTALVVVVHPFQATLGLRGEVDATAGQAESAGRCSTKNAHSDTTLGVTHVSEREQARRRE